MRTRRFVPAALLAGVLLFGSLVPVSEAAEVTVILELQNNSLLNAVTSLLHGVVLDTIPGTKIHLLRLPVLPALSELTKALLGIRLLELNLQLPLPGYKQFGVVQTASGTAADWYRYQPAMELVQAPQASQVSDGRGVVVADINSIVDYSHPSLSGQLTGGYDFVSERAPGGTAMNQSASNFLDQSASNFLDQSASNFLDQSASNFLDGPGLGLEILMGGNAASSHGTLCAGLITATAPGAMVMPLRVFDDNGNADTFAIVKAVRYAVEHGAHVINMSFGTLDQSKALKNAVEYADQSNVLVVTSAGNNNTSALQWPAGYSNVIATAATDLDDKKGWFSNYGSHVDISSPGVNIISAYPGYLYSVASGTSFAAPITSGAIALLISQSGSGVTGALTNGAINIDANNPGYAGKLGRGRLDILRAMEAR